MSPALRVVESAERHAWKRAASWLVAVLLLTAPAAVRAETCEPARIETGRVAGVAGGGDLRLEDGRLVRLASMATDFGDREHAGALHTALNELAVGRDIAVASARGAPDRYGRIEGLVQRDGAPDGRTLQQELIELGLTVVRPEAGYLGCAALLATAENAARAQRLGLWQLLPRPASAPDRLRALKGRFTVMEGRIFAAGAGRNMDYLNFGRLWREDATVRIPHRDRRAFVDAGIEPASLEGRRVLVRGVIFEAGGPAIEARWPQQLLFEGN